MSVNIGKFMLSFSFALVTATADAEPLELTCNFDGFSNQFSIWLDFDQQMLFHGDEYAQNAYPITSESPRFVTAVGPGTVATGFQDVDIKAPHGGSVWVVNREIGQLFHSGIGLDCGSDGECKLEPVNTWSQSGVCRRKLF